MQWYADNQKFNYIQLNNNIYNNNFNFNIPPENQALKSKRKTSRLPHKLITSLINE